VVALQFPLHAFRSPLRYVRISCNVASRSFARNIAPFPSQIQSEAHGSSFDFGVFLLPGLVRLIVPIDFLGLEPLWTAVKFHNLRQINASFCTIAAEGSENRHQKMTNQDNRIFSQIGTAFLQTSDETHAGFHLGRDNLDAAGRTESDDDFLGITLVSGY
jgi:hypothetical protein